MARWHFPSEGGHNIDGNCRLCNNMYIIQDNKRRRTTLGCATSSNSHACFINNSSSECLNFLTPDAAGGRGVPPPARGPWGRGSVGTPLDLPLGPQGLGGAARRPWGRGLVGTPLDLPLGPPGPGTAPPAFLTASLSTRIFPGAQIIPRPCLRRPPINKNQKCERA